MTTENKPTALTITDYMNAIQLSFMAHRNQKRRDMDIPYWTHVSLVSSTVAEWGGDDEQILAALGHDLIEDTNVARVVIDSLLSPEVGSVIQSMSASKDKSKSWTTRKLEYVSPYAHGLVDPRTYLVKLADMHANMTSFSNTAVRTGAPSAKPNTINTYVALAHICLWHLNINGTEEQFRVAKYNIMRMLGRVIETKTCPDAELLAFVVPNHPIENPNVWFARLADLWAKK